MLKTDYKTGQQYDDQTGEEYTSTRTGLQKTGFKLPGFQAAQAPQANPQSEPLNFNVGDSPRAQLFTKTFGTSPLDYSGTFNNAYKNLGQPTGRDTITANGTYALADAYIDRVFQKTGQMPQEADIRDFVAKNLDSSFASKFITGAIGSRDQIIANYVDPHLAANNLASGQSQGQDQINQGILGLNQLNQDLFTAGKEQLGRNVEEAYIPQKRSIVEDLASQGQLGQANSRWSLDALEGAKQRSLTQGLGNLGIAQAQGGLDIGKTAQSLLANQRGLEQQSRQFGLDYELQRKGLSEQLYNADFNRGLQQQQLSLAAQLGKQQAEANKPGALDYFNTALNAGGTAGLLKLAFKGGN